MFFGLIVGAFFLPPRDLPCPTGYRTVGTARSAFDVANRCPCVCEAIQAEEGIRDVVPQGRDWRNPTRMVVFAAGMIVGLALVIVGIRPKA
jgi:hypothetical protein